MIKIIFFLLLFNTICYASDEWTYTDTLLEGTLYIVSSMDVSQTLTFGRNPKYIEMNPILGKHPSKAKIIGYPIIGLITHTYISSKLDKPYRELWQMFWISVEVSAVQHNRSEGIGIKIHF